MTGCGDDHGCHLQISDLSSLAADCKGVSILTHVSSMSLIVISHIVVCVVNLSHEAEELLWRDLAGFKQIMLVHQEGWDDVQLIMVARFHELEDVEFELVHILQITHTLVIQVKSVFYVNSCDFYSSFEIIYLVWIGDL